MISQHQVEAIAKLARISLNQEEAARLAKELDSVLEYFAVLEQADTEGVEPMTHTVHRGSEAREDRAERETKERVEAMRKAMGVKEKGYLRVPGVLDRMKHD